MIMNKKQKRLLCCVLTAGVGMMLLLLSVFLSGESEKDKEANPSTVIEVWHVDSFEGGRGSRVEFLKRRALSFTEKNKDTLILVRALSEEGLTDALSKGLLPDLFSVSGVIAKRLLPYIQPYCGALHAEEHFAASGRKNGEQLFLPWHTGGYLLFAYNSTLEKAGISTENFTENPLDSRIQSGKSCFLAIGEAEGHQPLSAIEKWQIPKHQVLSQVEAYRMFCAHGSALLLGTQRDFFRLQGRAERGGESFVCHALPYTDLVQYLAIGKDAKKEQATGFASYLTEEESQTALTEIGMLSVCGYPLYTGYGCRELEQALSKASVRGVL